MKRVQQNNSGSTLSEKDKDLIQLWLFGGVLFLSVTVMTGRMSLILAAVACLAALPLGKTARELFRSRLCIPVLGLGLFGLADGFAAIYSSFGPTAISEFYKALAAMALAVILLTRFRKEQVPGLLWVIAAVCAVISVLSIDLACNGFLFRGFKLAAESLGANYTDMNAATGRVNGLNNNANVFAGIAAIGAISALYLADSAEEHRKKLLPWIMVGICVQGVALSGSRGALLCFGLSLLVWLIAAEKNARVHLFFEMVIAAAVTTVMSVVTSGAIRNGMPLVVLVLIAVSGAVMWGLDRVLGTRLSGLLAGRDKMMAISAVAAVLLAVGYVAAAATVKTAYTFNESGHLRREMELDAGSYTVSGDWDGDISVWISTENRLQLFRDQGDVVYSGPLQDAAFAVPEGTEQVVFGISAAPGTELRALVLSDGTEIPLKYALVPDFLANRLNGNFFLDSSFLLRAQYMKDAWALFVQKPLLGHGLSSTENLYASVQPFRYESLFVHNHVLQVMSDTGLLGTVPFLMFVLGVAWILLGRLRRERDGLAAMLLAGWIMINAHCLMEINFSVRAYRCIAVVFMTVAVIAYGRPLLKETAAGVRVAAKRAGVAVQALLCLYLAVFGGLLLGYRTVAKESAAFSASSVSAYMDAWKSYIGRDVFANDSYKLNFVGNAVRAESALYQRDMERWAEDLRKSGTYSNCSGLARYYYLPLGQYEEMFACSREGVAQIASLPDGWNLQVSFYRGDVLAAITPEDMDVYLDGVLALKTWLEEYNAGRLEEVSLTEENSAFLMLAEEARQNSLDGEAAYLLLTASVAP